MKKLLHERLREWAQDNCYAPISIIALKEACNSAAVDAFLELADEIERYYIPRPRFEDGEPVQFDDQLDCGYVRGITFNSDKNTNYRGRFGIILDNDTRLYKVGEPVRRPQPKVYDADGVEINVGDTVWCRWERYPHEVEIVKPHYVRTTDGHQFPHPEDLTHKEPDSLEKLRDDIWCDKGSHLQWAARLSALIERGV